MTVNDYIDIAAMDASRTDGAGVRSGRVTLLQQVLLGAVAGGGSLEEMGLRLWLQCEQLRPGCLGKTSKSIRRAMLKAEMGARQSLAVSVGDVSMEEVIQVVDLLLLGVNTADLRSLGRRVTLLGYAMVREPEMQRILPSQESIGELWGLSAQNKRSAVSAALKVAVRSVLDRWYPKHSHADLPTWYGKRKETRAKYAQAQVGNTNREDAEMRRWGDAETAHEDDADAPACVREARKAEHHQRVRGIPVKLELARKTPAELHKYLQALHEAAEQRQAEEWWQRSLRRKEGLSE